MVGEALGNSPGNSEQEDIFRLIENGWVLHVHRGVNFRQCWLALGECVFEFPWSRLEEVRAAVSDRWRSDAISHKHYPGSKVVGTYGYRADGEELTAEEPGWAEQLGTLEVTFESGETYRYFGVSQAMKRDFLVADYPAVLLEHWFPRGQGGYRKMPVAPVVNAERPLEGKPRQEPSSAHDRLTSFQALYDSADGGGRDA